MIRNGAARLRRLGAFLLTLMLLATTCFTPALAEDTEPLFNLSLLWDDGSGMLQIVPAVPLEGSETPAFWANMEPSALGNTLTVEVRCTDPAYTFYFVDEFGGQTLDFTWHTDAPAAADEYAHFLQYAVDGVPAQTPIRLFVSSLPQPEESTPPVFEPYQLQVPVLCVTEDGEFLGQQLADCWAGQMNVVAAPDAIDGYELTGAASMEVWVDETGAADPAEVIFTYAKLATPTPEPTEEPTPTPIPEAVLPVYYYLASGEMLDMQEIPLQPGSHTIYPESGKVEGLVLVSEGSVTVNVDENGYTDLASIVFQYEEPKPAEAVLPVYYYLASGEMLDMQEINLQPGSHTIYPESGKVEGLVLVSEGSVTVNVDENGYTDLASIVFQYEEPTPAEAVLPVYYYLASGEMLDMQEITLQPGSHTIYPESGKVEGLILDSEAEVLVTVNDQGIAEPESVVFLYMAPEKEPVQAQVTVQYIHVDAGVFDSQTITLGEGSHTVYPESREAADYLPVGNTSAQVTVDAEGRAQPDVVEFYYESAYQAPVTAELVILYQTDGGHPLGQDVKLLTPGDHTITADDAQFKDAGYRLVGEQSHVVHVDEAGRIEPASVMFTLHQSMVRIAVHYQDDRGRSIAPDGEFVITEDGEYVIDAHANPPAGLLDEYELSPGQSGQERVTVVNGVPSKAEVYFYYQPRQNGPVAANVTVCYYDPDGNEIAPAQVITLEPGVHQVKADSAETFRGYVLVSEPSITVEVYENGTFFPQEVAFYYRFAQETEEEKTALITVAFRDDRGNDVAPSQTHELGEGEHTLQAPELAGYQVFEGTDSQVTVTVRDGEASRSQVVFYYRKVQNTPSTFNLPVYYYDTMGEIIATTQYIQVGPGNYALQANPDDLPEGYELVTDRLMTVKVNRDGTTDPEEIAFYYRAPAKKAVIVISYEGKDGRQLVPPFTRELDSGFHTIRPDEKLVPAGYDPDSAREVQVYVSREGEAEPEEVVFTFDELVLETPIPVGAEVYRYAKVNSNSVAFRNEPATSGGNKTVIRRLGRSDRVYVLKELYNEKNEVWAMVNVDGRIGYMMSEFIDVMSQEDSDAYAGRSTPVPTFTPEPTFTPYVTEEPTLEPLPTPTEIPPLVELVTRVPAVTPTSEPTATPSPTPTAAPTATPEPYQGYALTTRATALRTGISASDMTIMHDMEANTLVRVVNQIPDPATGEMWSIISTLSQQAGFVQDSALRYITEREAQPYLELWEEQNREPEPTRLITPTPEPMQLEGYGIVLGDGVPFRQMQSEFSRIIDNLEAGTMVYISGQTAGEGQYWHSVSYNGRWGYIRADLVRMLTIAEEEMYLESLLASPTPATTNIPFDVEGLSSYGYVDTSTVNWREGPSTNDRKVGELRRYAFCLVLGTEYVGGVNWYHVKYGEETGYIHGDFFKQMTISELEDFLGSDEYLQGVVNNSTDGKEALDNVGFTGTGGLISAEDQWVHDNNELIQNTVNPWRPIATVAPILTTPTLEPLPGVTATPYVTTAPTQTPTFNPMPEVTYPTADTGNGGSAVVWVFVLGLLVLAVGGVFALVRHQQNKRRIAMRAAQRRAQAARAQQQQRPYARTAMPNQPRTGAYPNPQSQVRRPEGTVNQSTNTYTPYARSAYQQDAYRAVETPATPAETPVSGDTQRNPRVGRRTAYRQAQEQQRKENDSFGE